MPQVIHADSSILVVNKPADLLSVPGRRPEHKDCLLSRLQTSYPEALPVHRLDMSTSGLIVLARHPAAQRQLSQQFEQRLIEKTYLAVVSGPLAAARGTVDLPLSADWPNRPRQMVDQTHGKPAQTHYQTLSYNADTDSSRVSLQPRTGRTHQLRVHLQALGHPILGDDLYAPPSVQAQAQRLLLHATSLHFVHPGSGAASFFENVAPF